ncbi:tripartite tricarboxylate transporter TctB family protein [Pseudalkalibacillus sp. SCS-8]|uniref:tripartite tricarboxylate transporter TctB family protein n=1 Tax=Pseudalkalibacillus nanhaiensis TaxID=3115291 RepID=UPI0032DB471D
MEPVLVTEILMAVGVVAIPLAIMLFVPKHRKKKWLIVAIAVATSVFLFFTVRPFWDDYQTEKSMAQLREHLKETYPNEEWQIERRAPRHHSPYQLNVSFKNDEGYTYTYLVDGERICQVAWMTDNDLPPSSGKHYHNHCEES